MSRRAKQTIPREPEDDGQDPLAVINAELREQDAPEDDPDSPWLPLESNPVCVICRCLCCGCTVQEGFFCNVNTFWSYNYNTNSHCLTHSIVAMA